ncbi:hypothetical protein DFH09DRAFT_1324694 [Mycena vulgaris]|nr:hypothetical protein DFH09DRAFT_1324694 [Mycena vulgaris]
MYPHRCGAHLSRGVPHPIHQTSASPLTSSVGNSGGYVDGIGLIYVEIALPAAASASSFDAPISTHPLIQAPPPEQEHPQALKGAQPRARSIGVVFVAARSSFLADATEGRRRRIVSECTYALASMLARSACTMLTAWIAGPGRIKGVIGRAHRATSSSSAARVPIARVSTPFASFIVCVYLSIAHRGGPFLARLRAFTTRLLRRPLRLPYRRLLPHLRVFPASTAQRAPAASSPSPPTPQSHSWTWTFTGASEAHLLAAKIGAAGVSVILSPGHIPPIGTRGECKGLSP